MKNPTWNKQQVFEEIANAITHGIGAALAVAGLVIIVVSTSISREPGFLVYAVTLVLLYITSTLYHSMVNDKAKNVLRKLDHMAIFLLIAGTYTPYCLSALDGWPRWLLLGSVWGCAAVGIIIKCFFTGRREWISVTAYLVAGWMAIFAIGPIYHSLSFRGFALLLAGGVAYTAGTYFYMNARIRFGHTLWHLWVLAGSAFHFFSIMSLLS